MPDVPPANDNRNRDSFDAAAKALAEEFARTQPDAMFLQACREGDMSAAQAALENGADINARTEKGETALHLAALALDQQATEFLIEKKLDPNARATDGATPLMYAARNNRRRNAALLLGAGAAPDLCDAKARETPLMIASYNGAETVAALLLEAQAKTDLKDANGATAAMRAAGQNRAACLRLLDAAGADLALKSNSGRTALEFAEQGDARTCLRYLQARGDADLCLLYACEDNDIEAAQDAVARGAKASAAGKNGAMPLHAAARTGNLDLVNLVLALKPRLDVEDGQSGTPLEIAAQLGFAPVIYALADAGAEVNSKRLFSDETPLLMAVKAGKTDAVKALLARGAKPDVADEDGYAPLHVAATEGQVRIIEDLLAHGANPDVRSAQGDTPLTLAALRRNALAIAALAEGKADVDAPDAKGTTPLMHVAITGNWECTRALVNAGANCNIRDAKGLTAPLAVIDLDRAELLKLMLEAGADPFAGREGESLLETARLMNRKQCHDLLKDWLPFMEAKGIAEGNARPVSAIRKLSFRPRGPRNAV